MTNMTKEENSAKSLTVLVIEDHPDQRELLAIVLQREGYRVVTAANGIEALPNGKTLIIVNSATGTLYLVNSTTGVATRIDLGGETVPNGDGILLQGKTLYVVQNSLNQIAVIEPNSDFTSGEIVNRITSPLFRVPTTIARIGGSLYAVNARFGTTPTPDTEYEVVRVPE